MKEISEHTLLNANQTKAPKVNIGVKADPQLKQRLSIDANRLGMTLSEYVEVSLYDINKLKQNYEEALNEISQILNQMTRYQKLLHEPKLQKIFNRFQKQSIRYTNDLSGQEEKIVIKSPLDVLNVMLHSFKLNPE